MKNKTKHIIKTIEPGSIAEELELEPGDELLRVNGEIIEDVFDYHFQTNDTYLELTIRKKDGEEWDLEIEKEYDEEIGITFENEFMDQYRSCSNNCIFCFIDQMPPGMRPTLYFKDADSRLSFLQGNYITLTNMSDHDIDRIIRYHLAPINISFQTTNPELRCKMLHNRFAGKTLAYLDRFAAAGIVLHAHCALQGIQRRRRAGAQYFGSVKISAASEKCFGCPGRTFEIPRRTGASGTVYQGGCKRSSCHDSQMAEKAV